MTQYHCFLVEMNSITDKVWKPYKIHYKNSVSGQWVVIFTKYQFETKEHRVPCAIDTKEEKIHFTITLHVSFFSNLNLYFSKNFNQGSVNFIIQIFFRVSDILGNNNTEQMLLTTQQNPVAPDSEPPFKFNWFCIFKSRILLKHISSHILNFWPETRIYMHKIAMLGP